MIFLWFIVLHIPRAAADPTGLHGNELSSVFEALAFAGLGFIPGRTLPVKPRSGEEPAGTPAPARGPTHRPASGH